MLLPGRNLSGETLCEAGGRIRCLVVGICCPERGRVEAANLEPGIVLQAPLISVLARRGAKPHMPIVMDVSAESLAAMIATQRHELRVHTPRGDA